MSLSKKELEKRIKAENEPRWHFHKHLNRCWLHYKSCKTLALEWSFGKKVTRAALELHLRDDFEGTVGVSLSIPFIASLHVSYDCAPSRWLTKLVGKHCERNYGFYSCDSHTCLNFHHDQMDSGNNRAWYSWDYFICHERLLKGKSTTEKVERPSQTIERSIDGKRCGCDYGDQTVLLTVTPVDYVTTYSRWWDFSFRRWDVSSNENIWRAGKGENSWDCEPTTVGEISFGTDNNITSYEQAADLFVKEVYQQRAKYG